MASFIENVRDGFVNVFSPSVEMINEGALFEAKTSDATTEFGAKSEDVSDIKIAGELGMVTSYNYEDNYNLNELINNYRRVSQIAYVADAIDEIVNTAIYISDIPKNPVAIDFLDPQKKLEQKLKETITNEFSYLLDICNFDNNAEDWFRAWYVDGRFVIQVIRPLEEDRKKEGIVKVKPMSPMNLKRFYDKKSEKYHWVYEPDAGKVSQGTELQSASRLEPSFTTVSVAQYTEKKVDTVPDELVVFVPSGIYDYTKKTPISFLHLAMRDINRLDTLEDHLLIYRINRAVERRVFYIDPGPGVPSKKANEILQHVMASYRQKKVFDESTGTILGRTKHPSMLEDFFLLRFGDKGTQIDTLAAGQGLSEIDDLHYFNRKAARSLRVPFSRLNADDRKDQANATTANEITREELKFGKFINRLRFRFNTLFYELLYRQLIWKEIIKEEEWPEIQRKIFIRYESDMQFAEQKRIDNYSKKVELLSSVKDFVGVYFSKKQVMSEILGYSESQQEELARRLEEEKRIYGAAAGEEAGGAAGDEGGTEGA